MKGQTHGGKGSSQRPTNKRRFEENYEKIFNKKAPENKVELDEGVHIAEGDGRSGESKLREHVEGQGVQGQTEQEQAIEPVAWRVYYESNQQYTIFQQFPDGLKHLDVQPLYTNPPEQKQAVEPVAWLITHHENQPLLTFNKSDWVSERFTKTPLYAHPPKREPLSDDVIDRLRRTDLINVDCGYAAGLRLARLIEKAHGIGE